MGRTTRPFIDKRKAQTFNLVFRSAEDDAISHAAADAASNDAAAPPPPPPHGEGLLVDASLGVGLGRPDPELQRERQAERIHPMDFWTVPETAAISDARRRELIELGFPDDGYDYLKHLRAPGGKFGEATLEGGGSGGVANNSAAAAAMQLHMIRSPRECS